MERCITSLINQTYRDIEIILVDDGSPDACPALCDALAQKDRRIRVIHKTNGGLSSARNAGLRVALGDYVSFVDSDDVVSVDMYEKMLRVIEAERVDFVMSDYIRVPKEGKPFLKSLEIPAGRYDKSAIFKYIFPQLIMGERIEYGPLLSVWHCMYRTAFLNKFAISFDEEVRWSEDNIFSAIVGYYADSFYYMKGEGLYYYYQNDGTITTAYRPGAWSVYRTMNHHLHSVFDHVEEFDFSRQLKLHIIYYACNCIGQSVFLPRADALKAIKEILNSKEMREAFSDFKMPNVSWKLKIQLYLMKYRLSYSLYVLRTH